MGTFTQSLEFKLINWLSIVCALLVIILAVYLRRSRPEYANQPILGLQMAVAAVNIVRHVFWIYGYSEDRVMCSFIAFGTFFFRHLNILFNVAIALKLQLFYMHRLSNGGRTHYLLYLVPLVFFLGIDLLPFMYEAYGMSQHQACYLTKNSSYVKMFNTWLFYITCIPGYIYCLIINLVAIVKLKCNRVIENGDLNVPLIIDTPSSSSEDQALIFSTYPAFSFLCHSGAIVYAVYDIFNLNPKHQFFVWLMVGVSTNGFFNLVSFLIDPVITYAFISEPEPTFQEPLETSTEVSDSCSGFEVAIQTSNGEHDPNEINSLESEENMLPKETPHQRYVRECTEREEKRFKETYYKVW